MAESLPVGFRLEEPYAKELLAITEELNEQNRRLGKDEVKHHQVARSILIQALNKGETPKTTSNEIDAQEFANLLAQKLTDSLPSLDAEKLVSAIADRIGPLLRRESPGKSSETMLATFFDRTFEKEKDIEANIQKLRTDILRLVDHLDKLLP